MMNLLSPYVPAELKLKLRTFFTIRNIRIQARLILLFLLLSLVPMLVTSLFSYQQSSRAIEDKINTYSRQVVNQVAQNIEAEMTRLENDTIDVGFSEIVQNTLVNYGRLGQWEALNDQDIIRDMMVKKFTFNDITDVVLFTKENNTINAFGDTGFKLNMKPAFQNHLLQEVESSNGVPVWMAMSPTEVSPKVARLYPDENDRNGIIVGKAIRSLYEGDYIGAVVIRIREDFFSDVYQDIDIGKGSEIFILDKQGVVVSSRTDEIPFKKPYQEKSLIKLLRENERNGSNVFSLRIKKHPYLVAYAPINDAGWYVVSTIPYSYLNLETRKIRNRIIFMGIGCFLLAVFLSVIFTRSISEPLNKLIKAMNEVKTGNFSIRVTDNNQDEIAEVTRNFNIMIVEINKLLEDIKHKETQKRNAELKALQAQINPHFLSNVLNTAKMLASAQKAENLESLLSSLIQLLHISMGKEEEFITVSKEIEYLKNYLNILEFRYYHKYQVSFEIETEINENKLPKFLLQPILENSIIHGIGPKKGEGAIVVKGFRYEKNMIFTITDDGIGMTPDILHKVFQEHDISEDHFSGIGIRNVQERIQLYFGEEYGLRIDSSSNHYTIVEITLPIIR
ncbi:MAG TPA: two-component sensor histidine kinase [Firmicutes bacterium]|jgi:two-component system, sensor histidine kinase YesM|nr:two-component sensor histidine kinase [Bacillota bacterium]